MRQIKFRAWDGKEMIEPYCVRGGKACIIRPCNTNDKVLMDENGTNYYSDWDIDVSTDYPLMQFTGLLDSKGNQIYEGDVVTDGQAQDNHCISGIHAVKYEDGGFFPFCISGWEGTMRVGECKVIGNIHQNPELLDNDK